MKMRTLIKYIIPTAAILLTALLIACGNNGGKTKTAADTDGYTEGQSDTSAQTEGPSCTDESTDAGTTQGNTAEADTTAAPETETEFIPDPPETDKLVIEAFEENPGSAWNSLDWTGLPYGIVNPVLSGADELTDIGNGLKVTLPAGASCQYLTDVKSRVATVFEYVGDYEYLRIWVCNRTGGSISIGAVYDAVSASSATDGEKILTYLCSGRELTLPKNDASGMGNGKNTAVAVPDGFEGWVAFPLNALTQNWSNPEVTNLTAVKKLTFDIRSAGFNADGYYILDELALTNSPFGERRKGSGMIVTTDNEKKKQQIETAFAKFLNTEPTVTEIPEYTPTMSGYTHIKAITYEGLERDGKKTKVFAYVGFPEGASESNKVPAIVLIHGGGGHAFLEWVKMWNDRGYAAIAMDNTGFFPTQVNAGESEVTQGFSYGLSGIFAENGYVNAPNNDDMASSDGSVENMWMYHAVGQTIIANNVLRADKRVDKDKIGVTGISWGGVITSIAIGYDTRFAFAIPIYGSGYLTEAKSWMGAKFAGDSTQALWSAADNFGKVDMPVLWLCWNDDSCFSVNSNSMSFADTVKLNSKTRISMINGMLHSHGCGWSPSESMAFADSVVKNGAQMTGLEAQPSGRKIDVKLNVDGGASVKRIKLYYLTEPYAYSKHEKYGYTDTFMNPVWKTKTVSYDRETGRATCDVPTDATAYYIEVTTAIGKTNVVTTSEFIELK